MLIEKAYAKHMGSYRNLVSGNMEHAFMILTGAFSTSINLDNELNLNWSELKFSKRAGYGRMMVFILVFATKMFVICRYLMGAATERSIISKVEYESVGLASNHAYSLIDISECKGERFVKLRNPWDSDIFHSSNLINDNNNVNDILKKMYSKDDEDVGLFWMPFKLFCRYVTTQVILVTVYCSNILILLFRYFERVVICQIVSGLKYRYENIADYISMYHLVVSITGPVHFTLYQKRTKLALQYYQ